MKKIFSVFLYSLLFVFAFIACSENNEKEGLPFNPDDQELTILPGNTTSTSFSFDIQAKDASIPYLCLYVDKNTIDRVPKGELPDYLMSELKTQAEEKGVRFQDYITSLAVTGNLTGKVIEGLLPGQIYELVAFAVSGTRIANKAEFRFFETLAVDPIECMFDVEANVEANPTELIVTPTDKEADFYFNLMKKEDFDAYIASGYTIDDIVGALFQNDFDNVMAQIAPDGQLLPEDLQELQEKLFHKGKMTYRVIGLVPETKYVWMAVAFKVAEIDNAYHIVMASTISSDVFVSAPKLGNGMAFDIAVQSVQLGCVQLSITPNMLDKSFLWCCEAISEENNTLTGQELASNFMNAHQAELDAMKVSGKQEIKIESLQSETCYYVLAWGCDKNGVTTLPSMYEFKIGGDGILTDYTNKDILFENKLLTITPAVKLNTIFSVKK